MVKTGRDRLYIYQNQSDKETERQTEMRPVLPSEAADVALEELVGQAVIPTHTTFRSSSIIGLSFAHRHHHDDLFFCLFSTQRARKRGPEDKTRSMEGRKRERKPSICIYKYVYVIIINCY